MIDQKDKLKIDFSQLLEFKIQNYKKYLFKNNFISGVPSKREYNYHKRYGFHFGEPKCTYFKPFDLLNNYLLIDNLIICCDIQHVYTFSLIA